MKRQKRLTWFQSGYGQTAIIFPFVGANAGYGASWTIQRRYDIAYQQCMYAKGNQIPGFPAAYAPPPLPSPLSTPPRP
jgi:hypothetical protein